MRNHRIKWTFTYLDNKCVKQVLSGEERSETLAIKKLWDLSREHNIHSLDAFFVTKDNKVCTVSTITGKVHR